MPASIAEWVVRSEEDLGILSIEDEEDSTLADQILRGHCEETPLR